MKKYIETMRPFIGLHFAQVSGRAFRRLRLALLGVPICVAAMIVVSAALVDVISLEVNVIIILALALLMAIPIFYAVAVWIRVFVSVRDRLREQGVNVRRAPDLRGPTLYQAWLAREGLDRSTVHDLLEPGGPPAHT